MATAQEIADGFNTASTRKNWKARAYTKGSSSFVHFEDKTGMVHITYIESTRQFQVTFKKAAAAFQDYANAMCRSMVTILSTLQAAGLPFVAPESVEGVEMLLRHGGIGAPCFVQWQGMFKHNKPYEEDEDGVMLGGTIPGSEMSANPSEINLGDNEIF